MTATTPPQPVSSHAHLHLHGDGLVHRLPPETKLVGLVAYVVVVALTPRHLVGALVVDLAVAAVVVVTIRLPARRFLRRLAVTIPFLTFALLVPFIGGGERVDLAGLSLSVDGLWAGWNVAAKGLIGATASIVVACTTPVPDLITGLGRLRLPPVLVAIIAFMFRYLDLILDQVGRTRQAMVARAHDPRWLWQAGPLASASGALFVRTYERGERVHGAMLARGWTGSMPDLDRPTTGARPWLTSLVPAGVAIAALSIGAIR